MHPRALAYFVPKSSLSKNRSFLSGRKARFPIPVSGSITGKLIMTCFRLNLSNLSSILSIVIE